MSSQVIDRLKDKPRPFEVFLGRLLPFDHIVLLYCWIIIILTVNFARPLGDYAGVLLFHLGMIILVVLLAQYARSQESRPAVFVRLLYPVIMMTFFYQFSGVLSQTVMPRFFDADVVAMETALLGIETTLWLDNYLNVAATELLSAAYFSYYFMIPGLALVLFMDRRDREIRRFMTATCVTFFISYLVFIFYPVAGPRFHFADQYQNEITGVVFRPLVQLVIDKAAFKGGAMPSSHVAEAIIVMLFAVRNYGRKAYFLIAVVIGLTLGTIYGRFHYVSDVAVGIVMAFIIYWLTLNFYPTRKNFSRKWQLADIDQKRKYVSDSV